MASLLHSLPLTLFFAFLLIANPTFAADSPSPSPSSPTQLPPDSNSPPPPPAIPSPSPALDNSPPAPPMSDPDPDTPSPSPSPSSEPKKSPSPAPVVPGGVSRNDKPNAGDLDTKDDSSDGGMSGGKKAGIAFGVIGAACLAGLGVLVYKKRQLNIRRSQYGNAARREFL
ncbi:hypothetical protein ACP275_04G201500 [Erythranthe tilingii]